MMDSQLSWAIADFGRAHPDVLAFFAFITRSYAFKTLPLVAALVALWFLPERKGRRAVLSAVAGCFLAVLIARLFQEFGPFRPRPLFAEDTHFLPSALFSQDWSSFPSDTLSATAALGMGIFLFSRRAGLAALLWIVLIVAGGKFVTGGHYASDLAAGLALGMGCTLLCWRLSFLPVAESLRHLDWPKRHPGFFYGFAFLLMFEITTLFDDARAIAGNGARIVAAKLAPEEVQAATMRETIADQ